MMLMTISTVFADDDDDDDEEDDDDDGDMRNRRRLNSSLRGREAVLREALAGKGLQRPILYTFCP